MPPIRSASISSPGVVRPGTRLVGQSPVYDPKLDPESRSLEVTPITLYVSERASEFGTLISVNEHYISYPIRNGLIRVINQSSVNRILLRKHESHVVTELAFFSATTDLLVSAGSDNHIVVWRLAEDTYASKPMTRDIVRTLPVRASRVKWHPVDSTKIVIVQDSSVFVTDYLNHEDDDEFDLQANSVACNRSQGVVHDVVFTPDGQHVVTAGADGLVHVYRVGSSSRGQDADYLRGFNPLNGAPLNSLHFVAYKNGSSHHAAAPPPGSSLLIGGQANTVLSVWTSPVDDDAPPQAIQTVRLNSTHAHEVVLDATHQFLYVADRSHAVLYVFHLSGSGRLLLRPTIDHVTEFALAYPILSMTVLNKAGSDDAMQLYCIQTQAIQRYHVPAAAVYIAAPPPLPTRSPSAAPAYDGTHHHHAVGQSVGALTAEDDDDDDDDTIQYEQSAAESPRALAAPATDFNGSEAGLSSMLATDGGGGSVGGRSSGSSTTDDDDHRDVDAMITQLHQLHHTTNNHALSSPRSVSSLPMPPPIPPPDQPYNHASSSPTSNLGGFPDDGVSAVLRRLELQQREHHEQLKDQFATLAAQVSVQVDKSVKKHMQGVVVPAIGRIVLHTMEHSVLKPVQKAAEDAILAGRPDGGGTGLDVRDAFRETFQSHIIPSFQAATQRMFEQIQDTFVKGTQAKVVESNANLTEFQAQLTQLTNALSRVGDQLAQLPQTAQDATTTTLLANESHDVDLFAQQCLAIQTLLENHQFEEGFQLALGAENVALVRHACEHVEPSAVLGKRPSSLSQMIVLCLVQQLGSDVLNLEHLALHLHWLRESLLVMNPKDQAIAPFVQNVMHELKATLAQVPDHARDSQYTLVHHILNSMLSFAA
ncbi:hypothetical protein DYB37_009404 [Aphanomyces astaci]|uniref:Enhancer of mRNA-decapping protein 4 C-terminal domain-containing protein n=1 Tax=Aphanomyces astaci TaxID=112090 RepID=A0A3R6Y2B0_APHAT|nr:hypothetical protein DYB37_009404 [Aphanomyces astaci]